MTYRRPSPKEPWPDVPEGTPALTTEDKMLSWRRLRLLESWRKAYSGLASDWDLACLDAVAGSDGDLHKACLALEGGCRPAQLRDIFT